MENDGGLDDLFGALSDDESAAPSAAAAPPEPAPEADTPPVDEATPVTNPIDATAALNAAFIEAATARSETPPMLMTSAPAPSSGAVESESALPLTRRELRERQRSQDEGGDVTAAPGPIWSPADAEAFDPSAEVAATEPPPPVAAIAEPVIPPVPAAAEPVGTDAEQPPTEPFVPAFAPVAEPAAEAPPEPAEVAEVSESPSANPITDPALVTLAVAPIATPAPGPTPAASGPTATPPRQQVGRGFPIDLEPPSGGRRGPSVRWLAWFLPLVIILGGAGFGGYWAWSNYEDKIREVLGWEIPNDYPGTGNGEAVIITILPGYFGDDVAVVLHNAGVTKSFDAFHDLLLELSEQGAEPTFQPGNYELEKEMSAQSALDALQDPANRLVSQVIIPEGSNLPDTLAILAGQTGIPLEDYQAQAADPAQFGVSAPSLEGFLFPAQYDLDGTETAQTMLQRLVTTMFEHLDALGVPPEQRNAFLTMASIVQKESGPTPGDMAKVARVFANRIDQGMKLESDATVTYGTCVWGPSVGRTPPDTCGSVWLNQVDIDDTTNPYNTRANAGLPVGPIAMPGQAALEAVATPAEGPWLFFVAVNLATGETVFSETIEEHDAAIEQLDEWCEASDENASYCA